MPMRTLRKALKSTVKFGNGETSAPGVLGSLSKVPCASLQGGRGGYRSYLNVTTSLGAAVGHAHSEYHTKGDVAWKDSIDVEKEFAIILSPPSVIKEFDYKQRSHDYLANSVRRECACMSLLDVRKWILHDPAREPPFLNLATAIIPGCALVFSVRVKWDSEKGCFVTHVK